MSSSCVLGACTKNANGEIVESKLHSDLLHYTSNDRKIADEYYGIGTNEEFLSKVRNMEEFETDENGEITIDSLIKLAQLDLDSEKLIKALNKDIKEGIYSYNEALEKVQTFNEQNKFSDVSIATMISKGNGEFLVTVLPIKKSQRSNKGEESENSTEEAERERLHDTVRNAEMERRIIELLERHKVSVKFITAEREGGKYSTVDARLEDGLWGLIEINERGNTTDALAEEAGHFAVGALGENPLVQRLERLLKDHTIQREALGEKKFEEANLGSNPAREVAGKLVGRALQRRLETDSTVKVFANRIANLAKRVFAQITGNDFLWTVAKAESIANKIAYGFADYNKDYSVENALKRHEILHSKGLEGNRKIYEKVMDNFGLMVRQLEAISEGVFTKQVEASFLNAIHAATDQISLETALQKDGIVGEAMALDGIVGAFDQLKDFLIPGGQIDRLISSVDFSNPAEFYPNMLQNAQQLRQARAFLDNASRIVEAIYDAVHGVGRNKLKITSGDINNLQYVDATGATITVDVGNALTHCVNAIDLMRKKLLSSEVEFFTMFCEDIYGSKYVTTTVGVLWKDLWDSKKINGEVDYSINDLVTGEAGEDIDIFHRFIGSMSNNPDIIGQIADRLVKRANRQADLETMRAQERLAILREKAKKLGLSDGMKELMETDQNGIYTGNIITPPTSPSGGSDPENDAIYDAYMKEYDRTFAVNHGLWEAKREEAKKKAWEEFKIANPSWQSMSGYVRGSRWDQFWRSRYKAFNKNNSIRVEYTDPNTGEPCIRWVPNALYETDAWNNLKAKYKTVDGISLDSIVAEYLKIKRELDSGFDKTMTLPYRLPQFRGTFASAMREKAKTLKGPFKKPRAWFQMLWRRSFLESFCETGIEEEYGDLSTMDNPEDEMLGTRMDYETERVNKLATFGIKKLKKMEDLSTDLFHSMCAYAAMANSYKAMSKIVDALEVGREALYARNYKGHDDNPKTTYGTATSTPKNNERRIKARGDANRSFGRYVKFLDNQVYGIRATNWGATFGDRRLLLNKAITWFGNLGSAVFLKGNVLGGMVNTQTGVINILREGLAGAEYNMSDLTAAHKYYFGPWFGSMLRMWTTDWGKLRKDNRLSLFLDHMNAQNHMKYKMRNWYTTRSWGNNWMRTWSFLPYSSGDHYMQAMAFLATAHGTHLYNENGSFSSNLWDAFNSEDNVDQYNSNIKAGKSLRFKRFCPSGASEITIDTLDEGVYIKDGDYTKVSFEDYCLWTKARIDGFPGRTTADFVLDKTFKDDNLDVYQKYREQYNTLLESQKHKNKRAGIDVGATTTINAYKYSQLKNMLQQLEDLFKDPNNTPTFTQDQLDFLKSKGLAADDYHNIHQVVKDEIFKTIWTQDDESAYVDRAREENIRMHGIYNEHDQVAFQQYWYGNAFMAMKGWALGQLEMIYSGQHHSIALKKNVEGFANTAAKVAVSGLLTSRLSAFNAAALILFPFMKRTQRAMAKGGFTKGQYENMKRNWWAWIFQVALYALKSLTAPPPKDEKEQAAARPFLAAFGHYLFTRGLIEQQALIWLPVMMIEGRQLTDVLPVGFSAAYDILRLLWEGVGLAWADKSDSFYYYQKRTKGGRHKEGDTKFMAHLLRYIWFWKSCEQAMYMDETTEGFVYGRKMRTR